VQGFLLLCTHNSRKPDANNLNKVGLQKWIFTVYFRPTNNSPLNESCGFTTHKKVMGEIDQ